MSGRVLKYELNRGGQFIFLLFGAASFEVENFYGNKDFLK
jgi:hypothetical protein